jgi:hypothetical protein
MIMATTTEHAYDVGWADGQEWAQGPAPRAQLAKLADYVSQDKDPGSGKEFIPDQYLPEEFDVAAPDDHDDIDWYEGFADGAYAFWVETRGGTVRR